MYLLVLILMTLLIALLLVVYFRLSAKPRRQENPEEISLPRKGRESPCPLCSTMLKPGERVHSVIYPGKGDRLVEIYGCPYCYPPNRAAPRYCPSCRRELVEDELVFARLFDKTGKIHVHVNGCRVCMRRSG